MQTKCLLLLRLLRSSFYHEFFHNPNIPIWFDCNDVSSLALDAASLISQLKALCHLLLSLRSLWHYDLDSYRSRHARGEQIKKGNYSFLFSLLQFWPHVRHSIWAVCACVIKHPLLCSFLYLYYYYSAWL